MTDRDRPEIPAVTPIQMAAVDKAAVALGLDVLQLMELAGLAVARAARAMLPGSDPRGRRVMVLAGPGGNGGDGLVAARLLHGWGANATVWLSKPSEEIGGAAGRQLAIVRRLAIPVVEPPAGEEPPVAEEPPVGEEPVAAALPVALPATDLVVDALLGFGLGGPPTGAAAGLIRAANACPAPTLAVDLPSGLDGTTGIPYDPCVVADRTLTLALPKTGLLAAAARPVVGALAVADIGMPPAAFAAVGVAVGPIFATDDVVEVF